MAGTTNLNLGTRLLALLNVPHDTVELELRHLRALEGLRVERITNLVFRRALLEALQELIVDVLLHEDTRSRAAALAVVEVDAKVDPRDGVVDVGVLEDDVGRLAAQLERHLLQVRLGCGLQDHAADDGRSSEGNLVNVHVRRDGRAGDTAKAGDHVDDTSREASLDDELARVQRGERRLLSGFHHDGVTRRHGRANLPRPHEKRKVPGDDLAADTNGLVAGVGQGLGVGVDDLAVHLVRPAAIVSQARRRVGDVTHGHGERLAVVQGLNTSQQLGVLLEEVGQLGQHAAAVRRGDLGPGAVESLAGGLDGDVDILLRGLVDGADGLFVVRVDGLEGLAVERLDELVVDEPEKGSSDSVDTCWVVRGLQAQGLLVRAVRRGDGLRERHFDGESEMDEMRRDGRKTEERRERDEKKRASRSRGEQRVG